MRSLPLLTTWPPAATTHPPSSPAVPPPPPPPRCCSRCGGGGYSCPASDRCHTCDGKGLAPEKKVFEVHVEPGHRHGSKVLFRGEAGSDSPDVLPGDLIFILEQASCAALRFAVSCCDCCV